MNIRKLMLLLTAITTLFVSCDSRSRIVLSRRSCSIAIADNEIIVIDGFRAKKGGTLHSIQKTEDGWKIAQSMKMGSLLESPVSGMAMNDKWLAVDSDSRGKYLMLFKKKMPNGCIMIRSGPIPNGSGITPWH